MESRQENNQSLHIPHSSSTTAIQQTLTPNTTWVKTGIGPAYLILAQAIDINADIATVWSIVKTVEDYRSLSGNAASAHVNGEVQEGKPITLTIAKNKFIGSLIPTSHEIISTIDEEHKIIGWKRNFFTGAVTERYQLLEPLPNHQTRSYIGLYVPGTIGFFTKLFLGDVIRHSFNSLNNGIKQKAEKVATMRK